MQLEVNGKPRQIEVDTVLVAIGRDTIPAAFGADKTGIKVSDSGKIIGLATERERTSIDHIYAVGDCVQDVPELMPVA